MTPAEHSLIDKHAEFVPLIAAIEHAEESVAEAKAIPMRVSVMGVHESLAHGLIPHAIGEGRTVFPVLRRITGSAEAAAAMNRDHKEIARLTDELERLQTEIIRTGITPKRERGLSRVLSELRTVMQRHFEAEEETCFQVLKAELSPEETRAMCDAMERTAAEIRSLYE